MQAVVPAFNEALTIAGVVRPLVASGAFRRVLVVDDGSADETSLAGHRAGADVLRLEPNGGKGKAMLEGARAAEGDEVCFFDADLVGFRPDHATRIVEGASLGYDMVLGLRDYGPLGNMLQAAAGPFITGERYVAPWILAGLPESCWDGYSIETAMNYVADMLGGRIFCFVMDGCTIRTKVDKGGFLKGLRGHINMFSEMAATKRMLVGTDGRACKNPKGAEAASA